MFIIFKVAKKNVTMNTSLTSSSTKKLIMWYKVKELFSKGMNYSQISRNLGIDRHRVSNYACMPESEFLESDSYQRHYFHKLDEYEDFVVDELRSCPEYSSKQIEDHLKERYGDKLKDVCSKTIFNYVMHIRSKHSIPKPVQNPRVHEKLPELPYGEYGQVDFGEYWMKRHDGGHLKVYFFVIVLSRSRYKYVYFSTFPFNTASTVFAHELAFEYYGGRPKKLLYDQDKVLLHEENLGDLILTKGFRAFVSQQHFEAVFCRKSDPQSKGKVENAVKYVKYNFLRGREFSNIEKLNSECLAWLERTGNGSMHHGIYRIPSEEFAKEKAYLQPYYGTPQPPQLDMKEYCVRKDNTISYHCCYYTVPSGTYRNAGTRVMVEETDGHLHIYSKETGKTLAVHPLSEVKGALVQDPSHKAVRGEGITQKEQKIHEYIGDIEALDLFLSGIYRGKPRYYSKNLSYLTGQMYAYKPEVLKEALVRCLTSKAYNAKILIEVAESIRISSSLSSIAATSLTQPPHPVCTIQPNRTLIKSFEKYF